MDNNKMDEKIEIESSEVNEYLKSGSKFIWILGNLDGERDDLLKSLSDKIYDYGFEDIMSSQNPEEITGNKPIFVCEHGVTSLFLAESLRKIGIHAYSLAGGVDSLRS